MFEMILTGNWVFSFVFCSFLQYTFEKLYIKTYKSYISTCILFQTFFVANAGYILYLYFFTNTDNSLLNSLTIQNVYNLYGYFLYDNFFMITQDTSPKLIFFIHHVISLILIEQIVYINNGDLTNEIIFVNLLSIITEITNPFLNIRIFLIEHIHLKKINYRIIYLTYGFFRILLFPMLYIVYLVKINIYNTVNFTSNFLIISIFGMLYSMSCSWFMKIIKKQ